MRYEGIDAHSYGPFSSESNVGAGLCGRASPVAWQPCPESFQIILEWVQLATRSDAAEGSFYRVALAWGKLGTSDKVACHIGYLHSRGGAESLLRVM